MKVVEQPGSGIDNAPVSDLSMSKAVKQMGLGPSAF